MKLIIKRSGVKVNESGANVNGGKLIININGVKVNESGAKVNESEVNI